MERRCENMKINYDCMRDVLIALEKLITIDQKLKFSLVSLPDLQKELPKQNDQDIVYSVIMLEQAGYIKATIKYSNNAVYVILISGITIDGHKYLDSIRSPKIWTAIKEKFKDKALDLSFELIPKVGAVLLDTIINSQ